MGAIVSLLWLKNREVVRQYLARVPSMLYVIGPTEPYRQYAAFGRVESLHALLSPQLQTSIAEDAAARAAAVASDLSAAGWTGAAADLRSDRATVTRTVTARLEERLRESMLLIAALDSAHERDGIDVVALNEDVMPAGKTAALWARARGVPSVTISHSAILGRLYTVHREFNTDRAVVFGRRGGLPYAEMGVDPACLAASGNPAWDAYAALPSQRGAVRAELAARYGIGANEFLVVFATTWSARFTAFCDADAYASTLRAVLRAVRDLRARGVPIRLVVKDRPTEDGGAVVVAALCKEEGLETGVIYARGETERFVVAADTVVSVDSNISVEAMLAGVPAINLWTPMGWLNGPFFDAEDGVLEAAPEKLAAAIAMTLGDANLRGLLTATAARRLPEFAAAPGTAAVRAAELLVRSHANAAAQRRGYVWEELSRPRRIVDKGAQATYFLNPRNELLQMLAHEPRVVLDVGCGGGATGAELKRVYPKAVVHGVELSGEAAAYAVARLDRVLQENVETMDFAGAGFAPGSIDVVFFPDVLEHLYDPWNLLRRVKPFLAPDAQVLASIPNVRNLWLLGELFKGRWDYVEEGLLDVTHIRFFTRKSVEELFVQTGYRIARWGANYDPRVPTVAAPTDALLNVEIYGLTMKDVSMRDLEEFRTIQFLVDAAPA